MTVLFSAHSLSHSIDGNDIFTDMSFDVKTGTITEIRGGNGSGKSSLLKILCGLIKSNSLDVQQDVIGDISYLGHSNAMVEEMSFRQNFAMDGKTIDKVLAQRLNIFRLRNQKLNNLSYGEKRKIALQRALQSGKRIWIFDEPFAGLDDNSVATLESIFSEHVKEAGTIVVANHQQIISNSNIINMEKSYA
ncbi:MAG: ATP-binding cassette domain-containing protein [Proteobacteria bacterium]|nr:ATP-binding cassette domain-containing protein [SAR86 cluster bacterium]MDA0345087.1 ATP-binding cassette domain-containing protein [Pseudomonadota bacterium]MDA0900156.1 ATP-binding cassette domain-containing protein [Pseudomonadota bacterium]